MSSYVKDKDRITIREVTDELKEFAFSIPYWVMAAFGKHVYVAAIVSGGTMGFPSTMEEYADKPTYSRKRAKRVVDRINPHLRDGLRAELVHLTPYVRDTLAQWGTVGH